jgi:hypothetical protein
MVKFGSAATLWQKEAVETTAANFQLAYEWIDSLTVLAVNNHLIILIVLQ